ncbi:MAG TPA: alpha/beta hydrolase [Spirochaetota bacterium]|nr:alpha/beta hydrolase [Spirochaetota bacterium]
MKQSKINEKLQDKLREEVSFGGEFKFKDAKKNFKVDSKKGLIFENDFDDFKRSGFLLNPKGKKIFYQYWFKDSEKTTILFVPGSFENSSTHPKLIYYYLSWGYNVLTFDQEGSGESDGIRGQIDDFKDYIKNLDIVTKFFLKKNTPSGDFFLSGFSFGAFTLLYYLIFFKKKFFYPKKIVLFAPYLKLHERLKNTFSKILLFIPSYFFSKKKILREDKQLIILNGSLEQYFNLNKYLTDNKVFLTTRKLDSRIHTLNSYRWVSQILSRQKKLQRKIFYCPKVVKTLKNYDITVFYCEKEAIVDNRILKKIVDKLGITDNTHYLKNFFHDFLDYENDEAEDFYDKLYCVLKK